MHIINVQDLQTQLQIQIIYMLFCYQFEYVPPVTNTILMSNCLYYILNDYTTHLLDIFYMNDLTFLTRTSLKQIKCVCNILVNQFLQTTDGGQYTYLSQMMCRHDLHFNDCQLEVMSLIPGKLHIVKLIISFKYII